MTIMNNGALVVVGKIRLNPRHSIGYLSYNTAMFLFLVYHVNFKLISAQNYICTHDERKRKEKVKAEKMKSSTRSISNLSTVLSNDNLTSQYKRTASLFSARRTGCSGKSRQYSNNTSRRQRKISYIFTSS